MQTYRGTSRAKRYKPNQQDRCTAAGYETPAGVTEPQAETSPDKQSHPPQLSRGSHGGQDTHCLLVAPPPFISIMFTSFSCHVLSALILCPHQRRMRVRAQVPQDQAGFFFIFVNSYLYLSILFLICIFFIFFKIWSNEH